MGMKPLEKNNMAEKSQLRSSRFLNQLNHLPSLTWSPILGSTLQPESPLEVYAQSAY